MPMANNLLYQPIKRNFFLCEIEMERSGTAANNKLLEEIAPTKHQSNCAGVFAGVCVPTKHFNFDSKKKYFFISVIFYLKSEMAIRIEKQ